MPRGKDKGGKTGGGDRGGGKWASGGGGGLSKEQKEAVDALVVSKEKEKKKKDEKRIRRIVREEQDRTSDSDSDSDDHKRKKHSKQSKKKKHSKRSSSDDSSSSDSDGDRRRRQKEKRDKKREKSKAKKEAKIAESQLALQQVAELRAIIEEKEKAEAKAKEEAEAQQNPPPEAKYTIEEVKDLIKLSHVRAKENTPEARPQQPARKPSTPRTLFETITCSTCEVVVSPAPGASVVSEGSVAKGITKLLDEKLKLAEAKQSLSFGMGSTKECIAECNRLATLTAKHYTVLDDIEALKKVLADSNIDAQYRQSKTIISKLLEGIATRGIEITSAELHID